MAAATAPPATATKALPWTLSCIAALSSLDWAAWVADDEDDAFLSAEEPEVAAAAAAAGLAKKNK